MCQGVERECDSPKLLLSLHRACVAGALEEDGHRLDGRLDPRGLFLLGVFHKGVVFGRGAALLRVPVMDRPRK